jgi:hypothetical protein
MAIFASVVRCVEVADIIGHIPLKLVFEIVGSQAPLT